MPGAVIAGTGSSPQRRHSERAATLLDGDPTGTKNGQAQPTVIWKPVTRGWKPHNPALAPHGCLARATAARAASSRSSGVLSSRPLAIAANSRGKGCARWRHGLTGAAGGERRDGSLALNWPYIFGRMAAIVVAVRLFRMMAGTAR